MSRILGIDPGIHRVGWGVIEGSGSNLAPIAHGCIETDSASPLPARLGMVYAQLIELLDRYQPDLVSIEDLYFSQNAKTAMVVGQARGVIILAASHRNCAIEEYTPLQIKMRLTGYGRADKNQIQQMVKVILHLKEIPKPDDAADGLAAAVCACFRDKNQASRP